MQLCCDQERLAAALKAVLPAVPSRPLMVTDAGVLLSSSDGHPSTGSGHCLEAAATDREIAIRCRVGAQVAQPGGAVLPARTIADLVALLDATQVDLALDEKNVLALRCGRTQAHVRGWDIDEFPPLPVPAGASVARVEARVLKDAIGRVIYAASPDPARSSLSGTLMQFEGDQVTLVAADGFRLALCTVPLVAPVDEPIELVVPTRGMRELQKLIRKGDEEIAITLDEDQQHIVLEIGDAVIACQLGGKYPDYRAIIPEEWDVRAVIDRGALLQACRTARALSEQGSLRVEFVPPGACSEPAEGACPEVGDGKLVISSTSVEAGDGRTELKAEIEGAQAQVTLSIRFLADAVTAVSTKRVSITGSAPGEGQHLPVLVQPVGVEGQLGLIMPMQPGR
jgi:DNA polymerase-3 subunit beta